MIWPLPTAREMTVGPVELAQILCHQDERVVARENAVQLAGEPATATLTVRAGIPTLEWWGFVLLVGLLGPGWPASSAPSETDDSGSARAPG